MSERRYSDAEVAEIFERAAEAQHTSQPALPSAQGMTLSQIQEIGREAGFAPEHLIYAAKAIELTPQKSERRFLGLPIGVGLTVDLGRRLSDSEWDKLVVDLRETFDAKGVLKQEGSFRSWTNGNLQAMLEPTETGQRLRIRTVKGDARGMIMGGLAMFGMGVVTAGAAIAGGATGDAGMMTALGSLAAIGTAMFTAGGLRLPAWAKLRRRQMTQIAERVTAVQGTSRLPDIHDER